MDSVVGFRLTEKDDKLYFLIHHPNFHPISQTQNPTSSNEEARHDHRLQTLFLCPSVRWKKDYFLKKNDKPIFPITSSHEYVLISQHDESSIGYHREHHLLPLFWCNNKEFDYYGGCNACGGSYFGTDYYFCELDKQKYHKECVESPLKIKHPYHPEHSLQLCWHRYVNRPECFCCERSAYGMIYCCFICNIFMHPICAMQPIPFLIDQPKRHNHPLSFFTRQTPLVCNVCGLLRKFSPTYVCVRCNFVAHKDCMYSPHIIKISRHHHRLSYISSLQSNEWLCGVCRKSIDGDYGAYSCNKCSDYVVHSRCALAKDVWDGEELEGVPEKDYTIQDVKPFDMISEGVILHFLHDHHLLLEVNILYDEKKLCQACDLPIYEGNFYSCTKCSFILHESCANAPRMIQHALHPHPLTLKASISGYVSPRFICNACGRYCDCFGYQCRNCTFDLDIRCASISEPFGYEGHEHALFLALNPKKKPICQVCKTKCVRQPLNCIKCDFIVCFKCATLPYKIRYKHEEHFLTVLWGVTVCEEDWCEICECSLKDTNTKVFYWCNECSTFLHVICLLGKNPYLNIIQWVLYPSK